MSDDHYLPNGWVPPTDYLRRENLAGQLPDVILDCLFRDTPLTGHNGEPVVEARRLPELLEMLRLVGGGL